MKIEIEVTNPEQAAQILSLLASGQEWPQAPSEASEGERVEKHAEKQEAPKKRGPGRPRMTEEEKAEAARKRAEAKKQKWAEEAAKAAKEAEEDDSAEEPEPTTEDDLEKDTGKAAALDDEDDSDDSDKDPMEEAVELATKYLRDGNGKEVRRALKSVGASRVSDLKGAKVQEFLEIIKSI